MINTFVILPKHNANAMLTLRVCRHIIQILFKIKYHSKCLNSAEAEENELTVELQVKYTGRVFYAPHRALKSGCLIDVTNYPFDTQTCDLWIQSIGRVSTQMDLSPYFREPMDLSTYLGCFKESAVSTFSNYEWNAWYF